MRKILFIILITVVFIGLISFTHKDQGSDYSTLYFNRLSLLSSNFEVFRNKIHSIKTINDAEKLALVKEISAIRKNLKAMDFWLRYLEPISYKLLNGPLPDEWETEVFEKYEKPYYRTGAGLTLLYQYLDENEKPDKDSLLFLLNKSFHAFDVYRADSVTKALSSPDHFFLCNRLFILNMAAIYTTGFECPQTENIIPELKNMCEDVVKIYADFNQSFPEYSMSRDYVFQYEKLRLFLKQSPDDYEAFDHFSFIKVYVNPLFKINQQLIRDYKVVSRSYNDYSLNKQVNSIFSKHLYQGQNTRGIYIRVADKDALAEIEKLGKMLFYDPIMSGNNLRSCASCHVPNQFFADTNMLGSLHYNGKERLPRNTPSLVNSIYNHLLMHDGFHITLQNQAKAVTTNPVEMGGEEKEILKKVLSCKEYKEGFKKLLKYTPQEKEITFEHLSSAITFYYGKFSLAYSPFDRAMNQMESISDEAKKGFNIFMSKAQCATCHFLPMFNGVKPPYVGSEFEVLGVPADKNYIRLSSDRGRYEVNPAKETLHAFRTGTVRNSMKTPPYMHNGVFTNLDEVLEFYNGGGGSGRGLEVPNQTLSGDSLHLNAEDKKYLTAFIESLTEEVNFETLPQELPKSKKKELNKRKVNGEY
jgi:cytochrome c peroxidase